MVAAIGAAAAVGGAAISASGAKSAANTQSAASDRATMLQMQAAAQQRQDLSPWVNAGTGAQSKLNQYLGIGGVGSSGVTSNGLSTGLSPDQVRQQLLSQYTKNTSASGSGGAPQYANGQAAIDALGPAGAYQYFVDQQQKVNSGQVVPAGHYENTDSNTPGQERWVPNPTTGQSSSTVDEEGLNAAIAKYYEEQNAQNASAQSDPAYGSLLRAFHDGAEFDSGPAYDAGPAFSFTGADLKNDPGYQFGLDQGTLGVERGQASRGNFLSGAAMKELDRYNQDYAGTKFNEGFNRASSTYNTNQTTNLNEYNTNLTRRQNEWNTNLNAYNDNRGRVYNFLTGVSGLGQASAAGVASGNQQAANGAANNLLGSANAQSAAGIASGNALQTGVNSAVNNYNTTQSTQAWNNMLAGNKGGLSAYDFGANGQSNPTNQAGLDSWFTKYQG